MRAVFCTQKTLFSVDKNAPDYSYSTLKDADYSAGGVFSLRKCQDSLTIFPKNEKPITH